MGKVSFKPGNMIYPLPAIMVSVADSAGNSNIITVAWTGTVCTNPPMAYICVRPERHSFSMINETKEFVINLTTEKLAYATDYCGVKSGRNVDKFKELKLTKEKAQKVKVPLIGECPVNIECKVKEMKNLGSHTMFIADVVAVNVDEKYLDQTGRFDLNASELLVYSHGGYFGLGKQIGKFGYSVDKKYVNGTPDNDTAKKKFKRVKPNSTNRNNRNNELKKNKPSNQLNSTIKKGKEHRNKTK